MYYPIKTLQQIRPILVGLRKQAGLSQTDVASLLGVTQQSYAKIEANPTTTSVERLFMILRLLGSEIVLTQNTQLSDISGATVSATRKQHTTAQLKQADNEKPSDVIASTSKKLRSTATSEHKVTSMKGSRPAPSKIISPSMKKERW